MHFCSIGNICVGYHVSKLDMEFPLLLGSTLFVFLLHSWSVRSVPPRAYRLYEKRACNFHSDCTVGKILIVAKNSDKCVGGAKWKPFSSPVNATLVYWRLG